VKFQAEKHYNLAQREKGQKREKSAAKVDTAPFLIQALFRTTFPKFRVFCLFPCHTQIEKIPNHHIIKLQHITVFNTK
jgi:hypothetical protein